MRPHHRTVAAVLVIVILTVAAFLPVLHAEFLLYDDQDNVTNNPAVLQGLGLRQVGWAFTTLHPMVYLSHMLDVSLFGLRPGAHHFTNLILHAAAALLFLLLKGVTGAFWPSIAAAAVFAVHPMRVESVAWVSERKDVLAGLFWMIALLAYLRYARRPGIGRYLAVAALFVFGLMSKPMVVTLPFVLLLFDWWPLGRLRSGLPSAAIAPKPSRPAVLLEKIPLLLLSLAGSAIFYLGIQGGTPDPSALHFPVGQRIGNALISYVLYLKKTVWPLDLYPFYPYRGANLSLTEIAFSIALLAAVTAAALLLRGRRPWNLTGWFWYLGTLVPVIGLVQIGEPGMADRYSYLPSIGLLIAITGEARATASRWLRGPRLAGAAAATFLALLAALALLTWNQTKYWQNTETLGRRMLAGEDCNSTILNVLGAASYQRGDSAQAVAILSRAAELRPGYLDARFNLGLALAANGLPVEAARQFTAVLKARPNDVESLANRGRALLDQRLAEPALQDFDAALALSPDHPQILLLRGLALAQLNRYAEARENLEKAQRSIERPASPPVIPRDPEATPGAPWPESPPLTGK